ncbi:uncharacterized protein LOC132544311 [Ylistrum balloti]|uniref:uncharacterized protein LOC132544311 n=1 Tax=Ylistrum balloti TaxID=509963 RepID=UPI0029059A9D|nr:uncharacterized protein LOC132544311 [Ylistrum balloti]
METRPASSAVGLVGLVLFLVSVLFLIVMLNLVKEKLHCFEDEEYIPPVLPMVKEIDDLPIVVSAAHAKNFDQSIAMLQTVLVHLTRQHPSMHVIFYDIGLTEIQNDTLFSLPNSATIEIRRFPFSKYPSQLQRIHSGALKPVILEEVLVEYDFVMWVGPSLRFHSDGKLDILFDLGRSAKSGIIVLDGVKHLNAKATRDLVIHSVRDEPIFYEYSRELNTEWLLVNRRTDVMETVITPWVKCAVRRKCFSSQQTISAHPCGVTRGIRTNKTAYSEDQVEGCNIDRSVLSVMLYKLYDGCIHAYMFTKKMINYDITICS